MTEQIQLPASAVAQLLRVLLPGMTFGITSALGPLPEPWQPIGLNPQPLPPNAGPVPDPWATQRRWQALPGELVAVAYADALLQELTTLGQLASLFDGRVAERAVGRGLSLIAELEELCPRWPIPKIWRRWPQPPRPPRPDEDMSATELLIYGLRLLDGAPVLEIAVMASAVNDLAKTSIDAAVSRME